VLAAELGDAGIRAYNLQPGFIATERVTLQPHLSWVAEQGNPPELVGRVLVWLLAQPDGNVGNGSTIHATEVGRDLGLLPKGPAPG
jgi:NAD(P)-dependent dehydrogenase (short-subunit alcohol dehydrogenase family)